MKRCVLIGVALLLCVGMTSISVGCGRACTLIGCSSLVKLSLKSSKGVFALGEYKVLFQVGGIDVNFTMMLTQSKTPEVAEDPTPQTRHSPKPSFLRVDDNNVVLTLTYPMNLKALSGQATLQITKDQKQLLDRSLDFQSSVRDVNGPGCGPICINVDEKVSF